MMRDRYTQFGTTLQHVIGYSEILMKILFYLEIDRAV
jgi:hypothetical protein